MEKLQTIEFDAPRSDLWAQIEAGIKQENRVWRGRWQLHEATITAKNGSNYHVVLTLKQNL